MIKGLNESQAILDKAKAENKWTDVRKSDIPVVEAKAEESAEAKAEEKGKKGGDK